MTKAMEATNRDPAPQGRRFSRSRLALLAFLAIAAFFVAIEHRAHLLGALPYLLLLACPFIHLFHSEHGGGHGRHGHGRPTAAPGGPR